jgi:SnoaL-like domain
MSDPQLQELIDRQQIIDLLGHYSYCLDTRQVDRLASEFFDRDVDVNYGYGRWSTGTEATEWITQTINQMAGTYHALSNFRVELEGDTASTSCCCAAWHWLHGSEESAPADFLFTCRYVDEIARTAAGWRITRRRVRALGPTALTAGTVPEHLKVGG